MMTKCFYFTMLYLAFVHSVSAQVLDFQSKLFETATLKYSDDFDEKTYKGRYGHGKAKKVVKEGRLIISPLDVDRGYVVGALYQMPKKFVCHFRFRYTSKNPKGRVGFHIGNHQMIVNQNRQDEEVKDGYQLILKTQKPGKVFKDNHAKKLSINEWAEVVIEYQEGKMLLKVNGSENIYEDKMVTMGKSNLINFKNFSVDSLEFDYVRLWEVTE